MGACDRIFWRSFPMTWHDSTHSTDLSGGSSDALSASVLQDAHKGEASTEASKSTSFRPDLSKCESPIGANNHYLP